MLKYHQSYVTVAMAAASATAMTTCALTGKKILNWRTIGDGVDDCKCNMQLPCEFVQTPTYEDCDGILAPYIKKGNYREITFHGLNFLASASFKDDIRSDEGTTKVNLALLFDEKANTQQREDLNLIFSGKSGGSYD
ncbi:MAG TPA: DUF1326 domain-containing protein [Nitrososphaeraceae archaeon]